jgi:hypothetical protein
MMSYVQPPAVFSLNSDGRALGGLAYAAAQPIFVSTIPD